MAVRGLRGQRSVCVSGKVNQVVAETTLRNVQIEVQHLHCFNNRRGMIVALVVRRNVLKVFELPLHVFLISRYQDGCSGSRWWLLPSGRKLRVQL